jgi:hypothetical protein
MASIAPASTPSPTPNRFIVCDDPTDLVGIYDADVNLCVLNRLPSPTVAGFCERLLASPLKFETEVRIAGNETPGDGLLPEEARMLPGAADWLADLAWAVDIFRDLFEPEAVGLRLRILDKTMCPRFHVDFVPVRLVCTYGGVGTEWLPDEAVDRSKLGHGVSGKSDAESGLILDDGAIRRMPTYALGLMKGGHWQGRENGGAVHRSPRPTPAQPRRLLLTLDWL